MCGWMHRARFGSKTFDPNLKKVLDKWCKLCYNKGTKKREVKQMVTDAELIFWIAAGVLAMFLLFVGVPMINNYYENKDVERMFDR